MAVDWYSEQRTYFNARVRKLNGINATLSAAKNALEELKDYNIDADVNLSAEEKTELKKIQTYLKPWHGALVGQKNVEFTVKGLAL